MIPTTLLLLVLTADAVAVPTPTGAVASGVAATASVKDGFALRSADGAFSLRLRGYVQLDGRYYPDDPLDRSADTFLVRRARPILDGTLFGRFGFRLAPDFGGGTTVLQDAYLDWKISDSIQLRLGKFKAPFGLERLQSATDLSFVERGLPAALGPNRDLGVQLDAALAAGRVDVAVGIFNGAPDGGSADSDSADGKDLVARVFATPWKGVPGALSGLSIGLAASRGDQRGSLVSPGLGTYRTAGQQAFFSYRVDATTAGTVIADGARTRISPQATLYFGRLGVLAEAVRSRHEVRRGTSTTSLANEAWQLSAVWVLTGEPASFRWYRPRRPFAPDADPPGWGGLALVARYNAFAADSASFPDYASSASVEKAAGWAIGLDWTLERQIRLLLDYESTTFGGAGRRPNETVLFTRFQLGF